MVPPSLGAAPARRGAPAASMPTAAPASTSRRVNGAPPAGTTVVGTTETLASGIQLTYRDECVTFITSLTQSGIRNGDVLPGTSLLFTVAFKNLGDIGTKLASLGPL